MATIKEILGETSEAILDNLGGLSDKYILLEKVIPEVNNMLTDQAKELRILNKELGGGSKTVAKYRGELANLSKAIGVSIRDFTELADSTKEYHQGLISTTAVTMKFAKAVGIMPRSLGEMSAKLTILGHTSEESFTKMYENLLSVRDAYGLTNDQIDDIIAITTKYAVALQASDKQIEQATTTLAKFTSQLTSAGIEASRVSDLLNSMIDPDQLSSNLVLMSKLGITVSDMVAGDPIQKLEGSTEKLKALGQEIASIAESNRFQANELAKMYNLTLEEAIELSTLDTSDKALNTQKKLDQYRNEMATFSESIRALVSHISGAIAGPLSFFGNIIQKFTDAIGVLPKGLIALLGGITIKRILKRFSDWLGDAAVKFGKKMVGPMAEYLSKVQGRSSAKDRDKKSLTPDEAKAEKLGFGFRFAQRTGNKRDELNAKKFVKGKNVELSPGEVVEMLQSQKEDLLSKQKLIKDAEKSGDKAAYNYYSGKYGKVDPAIQQIDDLLGKYASVGLTKKFDSEYYDEDLFKAKRKYASATTDADKLSSAKAFSEEGMKTLGLSGKFFGSGNEELWSNNKTIGGLTEVMSLNIGKDKTQLEALQALKEFFENNEDIEGSKDAIEELDAKIKELGEESKNAAGFMKESQDAIAASAQANKGKGGFAMFGKGLGNIVRNIGPAIRNVFDSVLNAAGPWKILIKAILTIVAFIGGGIMGALGRNEKFQQAKEKIDESINKVFDSFITAAEPMIEGIANGINRAIEWMQPFFNGVANVINKIAGGIGGLFKTTKDVSNSVSTIEDSYKKEDLRTMYSGTAVFDSTNDVLKTRLDDIYYKIVDVTKKQDEGIAVQVMQGQ